MGKQLFLFLVSATLLLAQEDASQTEAKPLWLFSQHPLNEQKTYEEMNFLFSEGYAIGGMEISDGELELLAYLTPDRELRDWFFSEFLSLEDMEQELSALMKDGWYLLDIAWSKNRIYALLEKRMDLVPLRWRMATVDSITEINPLYQQYRDQGYLFSAISISFDGRFWLLFTEYEDVDDDTSLLRLHRIPGDEAGILQLLQEGYSPHAMGRAEDQYYLLYKRNSSEPGSQEN